MSDDNTTSNGTKKSSTDENGNTTEILPTAPPAEQMEQFPTSVPVRYPNLSHGMFPGSVPVPHQFPGYYQQQLAPVVLNGHSTENTAPTPSMYYHIEAGPPHQYMNSLIHQPQQQCYFPPFQPIQNELMRYPLPYMYGPQPFYVGYNYPNAYTTLQYKPVCPTEEAHQQPSVNPYIEEQPPVNNIDLLPDSKKKVTNREISSQLKVATDSETKRSGKVSLQTRIDSV